MKKSQKKIKKQNNLEIENNAILDKILLADYSVQDEVKILLLFTDKYVATLSVNDTLRMYKNDDIRMYNFDCSTDTIVEVITTCNTYTLLTVHLL